MSGNVLFVLLLAAAYLIGNLSPSTLLARAKGLDIKKEGSGNAGTTNALRVLGKKAALITLVVDVGKGFLAVFLAQCFLPPEKAAFCALAVFLGHVWPVLLKFQGGKGVATAFGTLLAVNWKMALLCLAVVVIIVALTRMVSAGSITAACLFPFFSHWMAPEMFWPGLVMAAILVFKHRSNIGRILRGEENRLSFGKGSKEADHE